MKLEILDKKDFDKAYAIMEESFPSDERRAYEEQKALLDNEYYRVYGLKYHNGIVAFITLWQFDDFAYIEHFAVAPEYRNGGIGSVVIKEILSEINCTVCLEVELPNTEQAKRRIEFYKRNGFYINDYPYTQPPYSADKKPIDLIIMTSERQITEDEFNTIKRTLFKNVYNVEL